MRLQVRTVGKAGNAQDEIATLDNRYVWHPYAPAYGATTPYVVTGADGVHLELADGRRMIDAMSSWWCMIHGYRHPELDAAARHQISSMSHVMFGGLTHEPAVQLAAELVELTDGLMSKVFFADSGSVSVDVAQKMAIQYARAHNPQHPGRLFTVRGGYHGDTFTPMSVCDPVNGMHHLFTGVLHQQVFAPAPPTGYHLGPDDPLVRQWESATRKLAHDHRDEVAALIVEPIVQGAGGMNIYSPYVVDVLCDIATQYGWLFILDEIATGFGRTGKFFAYQHTNVVPDILLLGKALTGGYLSLAAVLCTDNVASTISDGPGGALMHGPTFMANPLACAIARSSLSILCRGHWSRQIQQIERELISGLHDMATARGVVDVRILGGIGVVQLDHPVDVVAATTAAMNEGVWIRPFRDLIYVMPPYISSPDDLRTISAGIRAAVTASVSAHYEKPSS